MEVRWTKCSIYSAPLEPAEESDLKYTILLHRDGLSQSIEDQVTDLHLWPGFECNPAPVDSVWPVLWIGQRWFPWIVHTPVPFDCDTAPNAPASLPLELIDQLAKQAAQQAVTEAMPAPREPSQTMPHYEASRDDVDLATAFEPLTLPHAGATGARWSVSAEDAVAWGAAVIAVQQSVDGVLWQEIETITGPGMRTTALDARGTVATRLMPKTANGSEKRVRLSLAADGGLI